ncbi:MAG: methylenetetrahydrofolate reductase [NAD(P)H] [Myxococcales bacterium]|nr:methylenetetrahydrofolate reductase [NAD(P)H] [Myxococcales bacterium]MCB9705862.1 methylenetetrahydrofolate reductase [NAD(P)H] [Myxococcales bacterium]
MLIRERLKHKRPIFSFEFFPPKTEKSEATLWRGLESLAMLEPDFVSVTYGAGGGTQAKTLELVSRIKRDLGIEPVAHLTCVGATRDELARVIDGLGERGIRNILALRGDPPRGETTFTPAPGGLRHASELVALIRERGDFCVGAACYPEVHPEAPNLDVDLAHLKTKVDAGVDYLITQLFFDNAVYHRFTAQARAIGVDVPIIPGIMPVTNLGQIERFSRMCGATIPSRLHDRLSQVADDPQEIFWAGVVYAAHQCRSLLEPSLPLPFARPPRGVAGIHFYTLNKSPATRAIFEILRLARSALV